jgi:hypothetical protein
MRKTIVLLSVAALGSIGPCVVAACGSGDGGGPVTGSDSGAESSLPDSSVPVDGTGGGTDAAGSDAGNGVDASSGADANDAGTASDANAASDAADAADTSDDAADSADADLDSGPDSGTVVVTIDF